jgi:hypothetical protein
MFATLVLEIVSSRSDWGGFFTVATKSGIVNIGKLGSVSVISN